MSRTRAPEFRVYLHFSPDIQEVNVWAPPQTGPAFERGVFGVIHGPERLERFLGDLDINFVLTLEGDIIRGTGSVVLSEVTPKQIIEAVERRLRREDEIYSKIFDGGALSPDDEPFRHHLSSLIVASSRLAPEEGQAKTKEWFERASKKATTSP
ncbi:MAG: hypothetical protein IT186_08825 [Acidobacteria bacterium]|nr:hypothetical protein [Acidobacteriota bacterium]MCG3192302.1 hypothetical protein [Thermoanaerobaculia bacterium]